MTWTGLRIGGVTTSQPSYVLWRSPDLLLRVEFPAALLEEIRSEALRTGHALRGGGVELGGILLGTRVGDLVRVLAWVAIECQHAFGPEFVLSAHDEELLAAHLAELHRRSRLTGLLPVGWFATHLRGKPEPSESHLRLHAVHFGPSHGIFLLCQPDLSGNVRLHVTGGSADGRSVCTYANPLVLDPAPFRSPQHQEKAAAPERYSRSARWTRARKAPPPSVPAPPPLLPAEDTPTLTSRRVRAWMATGFLLATVALLLAAGWLWLLNQGISPRQWALDRLGWGRLFAVLSLGPHPPPRLLPSLHAVYSGGRLQLAWDSVGIAQFHALDGWLEIRTRSHTLRYPLRTAALASGQWTLPLGTPPASARLQYRSASGKEGVESVRFKAYPGSR